MNPYIYPDVKPRFNLRLERTTSRWSRYAVDFPIARPTHFEENNTARGEYYRPSQESNSPLVILIHGWGDRSVIPCQLLAKTLVKRGIACFILYLIFHSSRMPRAMKERFPHLTAEDWFKGYVTSVTEVRQIVDWAGNLTELNAEQVAVIGISLGGFIAAISMGIDKRISAGVFVVAGGNYENPAWIKKGRDSGKKVDYQSQSRYVQYLAEVAEKGFENVAPVKESYLTDPMTFAHYLRQRPILMINALWDVYIPREATLDFWEACGKPAITWIPATHSTIWFGYPFISKKIVTFLNTNFPVTE